MKKVMYSAVILFLLFFALGCKDSPKKYEVEYTVSGCSSYIYYFTPEGEQQDHSSYCGWSYSFLTDDENQTINLGATADGTTVYVKMYVNGTLEKSDSAADGYTAMTGTYRISDFLP